MPGRMIESMTKTETSNNLKREFIMAAAQALS